MILGSSSGHLLVQESSTLTVQAFSSLALFSEVVGWKKNMRGT